MNASEILVTGGSGSLGSRVVDRLRDAGHVVRALSRGGRPSMVRGDLMTGEGLEEAVEGVDVVVHCASSPTKTRQIDVEGTERLLKTANRAGISNFVFTSIVGVDRNPYYPYFRMKLEVEQMIEASPVPWTILRATQFHEFVLRFVRLLGRGPVALAPKQCLLQPIDIGEVATAWRSWHSPERPVAFRTSADRRSRPSRTSRGRTLRPQASRKGSWKSRYPARCPRPGARARRYALTRGTAISRGTNF